MGRGPAGVAWSQEVQPHWKSAFFSVEPVRQRAGQLNTRWPPNRIEKGKSLDSLHPPGRHLQVPLPQQSLPDCKGHYSSPPPSVHTAALRETLPRPEPLHPQAEDFRPPRPPQALKLSPPNQTGEAPVPLLSAARPQTLVPEVDPSIWVLTT